MLLLVGAYQLVYSRVPPHAALSTTVEATRRLGKAWASKLVNGVLRRLQRESERLAAGIDADAAVRHAMPDWLYEALTDAWAERGERVLGALQGRPPMVLRVDLRQTGRADYLERLRVAGIEASAHPTVATAVTLATPVAVQRLPGFTSGLVSLPPCNSCSSRLNHPIVCARICSKIVMNYTFPFVAS